MAGNRELRGRQTTVVRACLTYPSCGLSQSVSLGSHSSNIGTELHSFSVLQDKPNSDVCPTEPVILVLHILVHDLIIVL